MGDYPILFDGNPVGNAIVDISGLYYRIFCECKLPGRKVYRLHAASCGKITDLGILIPDQDKYILRTTIPVKKVLSDELAFEVYLPETISEKLRMPIDPQKQCTYLSQLEHLCLIQHENKWYIILKK